jgi:berberine-like enzyme
VNIIIGGLNAPPEPFVPEEHHQRPGYALIVVGFGSVKEHDQVVARLRDAVPPLWEHVSPMPYVALQQMIDEPNAWGFYNDDTGGYIDELTDDVIEVVVEHLPKKTSPLSVLLFYRLDGVYSEVGDDDTAFSGGRSPRFAVFLIAVGPTPDLLVADGAWVRAFWEALRPHTTAGVYVNAVEAGRGDRVRAAYGPAKYEQLARIKAKYDPANLFHCNANIEPAAVDDRS